MPKRDRFNRHRRYVNNLYVYAVCHPIANSFFFIDRSLEGIKLK